MGLTTNKARKSTNRKLSSIIKSFNNILMVLSLMSLMYAMGLCNNGECAYIEEKDLITNEIITTPPKNFALAETVQNISTWLVVAYALTGAYLFSIKREVKKK